MNAKPARDPEHVGWQRIGADAAARLIARQADGHPPLAVFDTRDRASFDRAHIPGAQFLSDANFSTVLAKLPRSTPVVIYCFHGNASQTWAGMFADFRFSEVYSVDGGHDALAAALRSIPS